MYKKGTDKIIAVYWFAVLIIIAVAVYGMVSIFYNHPYDIREVEANVLLNKIADCISSKGKINAQLLDSTGFKDAFKNNFLDECNLNLNVENQDVLGEQYYFKVEFFKYSEMSNSLFPISFGNSNLALYCGKKIVEVKDTRLLPKCVEKSFYAVGEDGNQYIIKILSIVRKTEQNVKE